MSDSAKSKAFAIAMIRLVQGGGDFARADCEMCNGTGWYGDNGPGIKGNREYHECECRYETKTDSKSLGVTVPTRHGPMPWPNNASEVDLDLS